MNLTRIRAGAFVLGLILPSLAFAQGTPAYQSGQMIAPHNLAKITRNGEYKDAGGLTGDALGRGVNPFLILDSLGDGICSDTAARTGSYHSLCIGHNASGDPIFKVDGTDHPFLGTGSGNVVGPNPTVVETLPCWNNTAGTLLKNCGTITSRNYWNNTVTGDMGANLVGGVEIATNSQSAISQTNVGKINGLYVNNTFGGGSPAGEGQRAGIFAKVTQNGATSFTNTSFQYNTGVWSWVLVNQGNTTVGQEANYHGFGGLVEIGGTGTRVFNLHGFEVDTNIDALAVVGNRIGILSAIGAGTLGASSRATSFDGAFAIGRSSSGDASWKYGYMVRGPNGVWPFANDSILIGGLGASNGGGGVAAVAGTGIDLTGITFQYQEYISDHMQIGPTGAYYQFGVQPELKLKDTGVSVTAGGLTRWLSLGSGAWVMQINTAAAGNFSTGINAYTMTATGGIGFGAEVKLASKTVATLPTCNVAARDSLYLVTDALGPTWDAAVAGGGAVRILALCDGTNWKAR